MLLLDKLPYLDANSVLLLLVVFFDITISFSCTLSLSFKLVPDPSSLYLIFILHIDGTLLYASPGSHYLL